MANISSQEMPDANALNDKPFFSALFYRLKSFLLRRNGETSFRQNLEDILEQDENTVQELRDEERHMLINILKFGELRVEDVMVPLADIVGVEIETPIDELVRLFQEAAHSRLPVYRETLDDPVGMVHIKDVIGLLGPGGEDGGEDKENAPARAHGSPIASLKRDIIFVPPSMPVADLFLKMQATHIHMALVIDEYGGTDGLVTIEDLVEEIVGEIEDEHDTGDNPVLQSRASGGYTADARVPIEDLEKAVGVDLLPDEREEDIDTLGGLVYSLAGRIPQRGELIPHPAGIDFEVVDADPRRIKRLRIYVSQKETPTSHDAPSA